MLHRLFRALGPLAAVAALAACQQAEDTLGGVLPGGGGETYDYSGLEVALALPAGPGVAVAVIDDRPYVLEGDESPRFVGTLARRGNTRVEVSTGSDRPLAEVLTGALARALERQGIAAAAVPQPHGTGEAEVLAALAATGSDRLLVLRLREWQTNAQVRVTASWHLEATVYDRAGQVLGQRTSQGTETVGTSSLREGAGRIAVATLAERIGFLLNHPAIAGALAPA
ncbi:MAG TPA: hypothetical protein VMM59_13045 [Thermohalobaculum sp.]|nr:hypothetical protein [Thermohalobaculum sp.]